MALPQYQVLVLDCNTGDVVTLLDATSFLDLRYSRKLNDVGALAMTLAGTETNYNFFGWDNFIEIQRSDPMTGILMTEETYLCRSKQLYTDDDDQDMLVVGALSLNHLIARRIVDPDDDATATDGYSRKSGPSDTVMRGYAREQMADLASADRQTPGLSVSAVTGIGNIISESRRYDNLLTTLNEIALAGAMDFHLSRTSGASLELSIETIGADKTKSTNYPFSPWVGLSPLRRNLSKPTLQYNRSEERNLCYVLGQGQGEQRLVIKIAGETSVSPFNRIEYTKDARNVDKTDSTGLTTAGFTSINQNKVKREFFFSPANIEPGNVYKLDWDVGDKVTALWKGEEFDLRITGVQLQIDANGETIEVFIQELYT